MDEFPGMIHPEAKFLSSYEPSASKIQWWDRGRIDIPTVRGRKLEKERSLVSQGILTASRANSIRCYGLGITFFGLLLCAPDL